MEILARNWIEDPDPNHWYPQEAWLDAFAEISDTMGSSTLKNIGTQIPKQAEWPPGIDSVAGGLDSIDDAYQMNHRGGEIGFYRCESVDGDTATVVCENPYPCAFDRGIVQSVVGEFCPGTTYVGIDEVSDTCRDDGGRRCRYETSW